MYQKDRWLYLGYPDPGFLKEPSGNPRFCFILLPKAGFLASYHETTSQICLFIDSIMDIWWRLVCFGLLAGAAAPAPPQGRGAPLGLLGPVGQLGPRGPVMPF